MSDCAPATSQQCSEINNLNAKLQYDSAAQLQHQSLADNQEDARGWSEVKLRRAQNAASFDHFINMTTAGATATAQQTGQTEESQTVSPVRTATGDAIVGGVGVSAEQVAANVANLATSLVPVIASALAAAIAQTVAALVPVVVTASGGASTPSQTQPKPTA